jgi:hypothetical protein
MEIDDYLLKHIGEGKFQINIQQDFLAKFKAN